MPNETIISALPVGELDSDPVRAEFKAILGAFQMPRLDVRLRAAVADEPEAQRFIEAWPDPAPDLLLLIPLRGLSAQVMERVGRACPAPCLIWPISGRFALPSSTLAAGALRDIGGPVELLFAPPDHPLARARAGCMVRAATAWSHLRRSRIGVVGGLFPTLVSCRYDAHTVSARLGPTVVPIAYEALRAGLHAVTETEAAARAIT